MALRVMEPQEPYNTKEDIPALNSHIIELEQSLEDTTWAKADAFLKAKQLFGLPEFAKATNRTKELGTMHVYANVAESYPALNRFKVSFKHHMVVATSDRRYELLQKAVDNKWSAERMKREIIPVPGSKKKPLPEPVKEEPKVTTTISSPATGYVYIPPIDPLEAAFKPFIEVYNQLYVDGALNGLPPEDAITLAFGQEGKWKLMWVEGFGFQMLNLKAPSYLEDGPSQ